MHFYCNLTPVHLSNQQTHIRISISGQIIDLFTNDNEIYDGFFINTISEYEKDEKAKYGGYDTKQMVFEKISLDREKVKLVIDSLIDKQFEIPTDTLIPNWHSMFLDCNSIDFAYKINEQTKTQSYLCVRGQNDSIIYKSIIINNYNLIKTTFSLDSIYTAFKNKLPGGKRYSNGDGWIMYKLTPKEFKQWKKDKPSRDYLESVEDTIDNYLKAELSKQKIELNGVNCFKEYGLIFGTNGKLKKIITFKDKQKCFFEEKREIRKCKSTIRKMFKDIDLSFINSKYKVGKIICFDSEGNYELR
jgi:hypothetical protein